MPVSDLPPTGTPAYPWTLFGGFLIGKKMERQGELLRVTLDLEDYNRLFPLINVAPTAVVHQPDPPPDGTDVAIDARAQTVGTVSTDEVYVIHFHDYWDDFGLLIDDATWVDDVSGPLDSYLPDLSLSLGDFKSFSDTLLAYMGPYTRAWLDPELNLHLTVLAAVGDLSYTAHAAPWAINDDDASGENTVRPIKLDSRPDYVANRHRLYVRGGTPASSKWVTNPGVVTYAGEGYYDAPGAITEADADHVADWVFAEKFRTKLTGTCIVPVGYDGWRVGQTAYFTCARLADPEDSYSFDEMPAPIQRVTGKLVGPGPGLTVSLLGVPTPGVVVGLTFAESLDGAEKATVTFEIVDPDESFTITPFMPVTIETDGTADIEYTLEYGDIEAGDLVKALANNPVRPSPAVQPAYHFIVTVNDSILPLLTGVAVPESLVVAQLADSSETPVALANLPMEWVLLQWADVDRTVPSSSLGLDDATGTTDATGRVYTRVTTTGAPDCVAYEIQGVALPIP